MELLVEQIVAATGGALHGDAEAASLIIRGVTWDSREVTPGCLYVALPGERVDGHSFTAAAAQAGALCALVSHPVEAPLAQVVVEDTQRAFTDLAAYWRTRLRGRVVGLSGSTGKTTTKALVRDVLAAAGSVTATKANQNNELGVPRTLLNASQDTDFIVVEMGMRGLGQLESLCRFTRPDWGLITNVGESHMELLGSRENIARAKAELFCALPEGGIAFVNAQDDFASRLCAEADLEGRGVTRVFFNGAGEERSATDSLTAGCPKVWATGVSLDSQGQPSFTLHCQGFGPLSGAEDASVACALQLRGLHNVSNAASAVAVGLAAGLSLERCAQVVAASKPEHGRQEFTRTSCGALLMNDAYNANPDSMTAALATFAALDVPGLRVAVLGDMGELGDISEDAHRRVGTAAAHAGLDLLVCVGELSCYIMEAALKAGMDSRDVILADSVDDALIRVQSQLTAQDAVLVKASHFMGFQQIVEGLVG